MKRFFKLSTTMLLIAALVLSLTGCGEIKKAETAVNNMFTAFKALDFEEARKYVDVDDMEIDELDEGDDSSDSYEMYMKALFDRLDYKIISSEKVDSNTVNVTTEITAVDMKPVLGDFFVAAMEYAFSSTLDDPQPTEEEINKKMEEMFIESATKPDLATISNEVVIKVVKEDEGWKIVSDDALVDALLGGVTAATEELAKSFSE